jgi:DNA-binding SARP family transcriptional activator
VPVLSISLLGPMQVQWDGNFVTRFESMKARALLAYLAAEASRLQVRSSLAGLLWPDWPQEAAQKNLRHTLYSLRKTLQDRQVLHPGLIHLTASSLPSTRESLPN